MGSKNIQENNGVINDISSKIIFVQKHAKILMYSVCYNTETVKNNTLESILTPIFQKAKEKRCDYIWGLGFSLPVKKNELSSYKKLIVRLRNEYKIKGILCEFVLTAKNGIIHPDTKSSPKHIYHYIYADSNGFRILEKQFFGGSNEKANQEHFLDKLDKLDELKIKNGLVPVFLTVCGECSIFGKNNFKVRGKGFHDSLKRIAPKSKWIIFNPSHRIFTGGKICDSVLKMKEKLSINDSVQKVICGVNISPDRIYKKNVNRPIVFKNGTILKPALTPIPFGVELKDAWYVEIKL